MPQVAGRVTIKTPRFSFDQTNQICHVGVSGCESERPEVQLIDNINQTLSDDLMTTIKSGSRVSIAAASFSVYAFQELKEQLKGIDELRFIFTSPSFTTEKTDKQRREFYIPRLNRERDLFGSEFEIKLRNELSLKAVAKECAEWIRHLCKGRTEPILNLCRKFNAETRDGQRMSTYSKLLGDAISSLIKVKESTDLFSFLDGDTGSLFVNEVRGLDDFELICFLIIR